MIHNLIANWKEARTLRLKEQDERDDAIRLAAWDELNDRVGTIVLNVVGQEEEIGWMDRVYDGAEMDSLLDDYIIRFRHMSARRRSRIINRLAEQIAEALFEGTDREFYFHCWQDN